jgi:hypothetical protein
MVHRREAIDCFDCESFLQLGIDAFAWLARADESIRKAIYAGQIEYDQEVDPAIAHLYQDWLRPCSHAEKWIATQESRGYNVSNVEEFRRCVEELQAIVAANNEVAGELAAIRDQAVEENRAGTTTDWEVEEPAQPAL